ncbi:SHOCT domain-containing protein [Neobacillus sp. OS1-2]|uniref:SHOCT domain-containing protein n=1 Tax=Neobacillus sp. OS1-2 TaxID=3070680 RepID=UPI0027DFA973|nr:SHOCT domain-containing protein [Neobacillus sp. OS1-2]WML38716.1 SHOCT domain-containing protein [Neobacillus sp. OS1-2]
MNYTFKKPNTTVEFTDDGVIFKRGNNDLMIHKALRGETKVLYSQIQEIKFKEASLTSAGYLQLSTPRSSMVGLLRTVDQPQNAVKFKRDMNEEALKLKSEIEERINNLSSTGSELGSLKELKSLLDEGIITQEEFDLKKRQILNI